MSLIESPDRTEFNPFAPGYFQDPTVQLGSIRQQQAVHRSELLGGYLVTRYDDVHFVGRDRRFESSIRHAASSPAIDAERAQNAADPRAELSMLRVDGDDHTRLRRLVSRAFTPKAISALQHRTVEIADELLDALARSGGGDLIDDYALRLPVQVISEMLGMPTADLSLLRAWSHQLASTLDPLSPPEARQASVVAIGEMSDYVTDIYEQKRRNPDDAIFSALIAAEDDGERLTHDEVIANVLLLYVAGHETTTNLIGNGVVELLAHPEQARAVRERPDLDSNVIEEVLRYNPPVQFTRRIALEDVEVGGEVIPRGAVVMLANAAANRDPRKWGVDADQFRVERADAADQLSFGAGPHYCLGAALARMEAQVGLPRLIRRFPKMAAAAPVEFEQRMVLRGVGSLEVSVG